MLYVLPSRLVSRVSALVVFGDGERRGGVTVSAVKDPVVGSQNDRLLAVFTPSVV